MMILQLSLLVMYGVASSLSCSCMPMDKHPQVQFLKADFVVLARVRPLHAYNLMPKIPTSVNNLIPKIPTSVYTLKIKEIFKGPSFLKSSLQANVNLTTLASLGFCGVKLQSGDYVISGSISNGNLHSGFCNFQEKWALTTLNQRLGMRGEYNKGRSCSIGLCIADNCSQLLPGCEGNSRNVNSICRAKYQTCVRNDTTCTWAGAGCRSNI